MPLNFNKTSSNTNPTIQRINDYDMKIIGTVRRPQLISTYGPGSIAALKDASVMISSIDGWFTDKRLRLTETNLQRLLKVKTFYQPKAEDNDGFKQYKEKDIFAKRFPKIYFCSTCHTLKNYNKFGDKGKCPRCNKEIIPSRFVCTCINGHIEDFPYSWWVHKGKHCENPDLKIQFNDNTGGLDSIIITCVTCKKSRSMAGCMNKDALTGYKCRSNRPWLKNEDNQIPEFDCTATMRCLQRGASNVYFPITASALTIPPLADDLTEEIELQWEKVVDIFEKHKSYEERKDYLKYIFDSYNIDVVYQKILQIAKIKDSSKNYTNENLMTDEYLVLNSKESNDSPNFKIYPENVPESLKKYIENIVLVTRLREVMALKGFRRITPDAPQDGDDRFKGWNRDVDYVPLSKEVGKPDWLPAIELLGEGIFIVLNEDYLKEWESKAKNNYYNMSKRLNKTNIGCDNFSEFPARYVLLHTLAHLFIRQLSLESGYASASLKERIYSSYNSSYPMAGILIYTSSSDSDGSLGGLVRQGRTKNFERIFRNMLQEASWCSSDPVCAQSTGQGFFSLNYAACHACTLIAETSCIMRNTLLDRCAVVGKIEDKGFGYFSNFINSSWDYEENSNSSNDNVGIFPMYDESKLNFSDDTYTDIWQRLLYETEDEDEKRVIKMLLENTELFAVKERPYFGCPCKVTLNGQSDTTDVTLIWEKSKVIYFHNNNDDYFIMKNSDWNCIRGSQIELPTILNMLKDR